MQGFADFQIFGASTFGLSSKFHSFNVRTRTGGELVVMVPDQLLSWKPFVTSGRGTKEIFTV